MPGSTAGFRLISDYALIGNTHSVALVGTDGSIDWCCLPHFDSGAVFCRLLDASRGGFMRVSPVGEHRVSRRYLDGTAVVETEFEAATGRIRLTDFMHSQRIAQSRLGVEDPHCHRLLRCVEGLAGRVDVELVFRPTPDFARQPAQLEFAADNVRCVTPHEQLLLRISPATRVEQHGDAALTRFQLGAGDRAWIVLSHGDSEIGDAALQVADPEALLAETCRNWREWDGLCRYDGPFAAQVRLSARVLKLLTFGPTGALVSAPTTSLPERIGGVRNWDYRYCWLRDAALVLHALMSIGYHEAAMDFFRWLEDLCEHECDLQIMYRLDGGPDLPERELAHLSGYGGSRPVRIGNAAASQKQLDVYGHVLDAALVCLERMMASARPGLQRVLRHLADQAAAHWREPDQGLWEMRCEPRHFLSSTLMCWTALDRAVRLADAGKLDGDAVRWRQERDASRAAILERGWNPQVGAFTQVLGGIDLDASALLIPFGRLLTCHRRADALHGGANPRAADRPWPGVPLPERRRDARRRGHFRDLQLLAGGQLRHAGADRRSLCAVRIRGFIQQRSRIAVGADRSGQPPVAGQLSAGLHAPGADPVGAEDRPCTASRGTGLMAGQPRSFHGESG